MMERPLEAGGMRESPRNDFEREVLLQFQDLQRPVSAVLKDISATGMFIRSRDSRPAGSNLSFELSLRDGSQPIYGEGEVVWMRRFELGDGHPAGMGIRFLDLGQESDRTLRSFITKLYGPGEQHRDGDAHLNVPVPGSKAAGSEASSYGGPLSGLTSSQLDKLYSYAGSASARPQREWSRVVRRTFSLLAQAAGSALGLGRGTESDPSGRSRRAAPHTDLRPAGVPPARPGARS